MAGGGTATNDEMSIIQPALALTAKGLVPANPGLPSAEHVKKAGAIVAGIAIIGIVVFYVAILSDHHS